MDVSTIPPEAWTALAKGGGGASLVLAIVGWRLYAQVINLLQRVAVLEALQGVKSNEPKS